MPRLASVALAFAVAACGTPAAEPAPDAGVPDAGAPAPVVVQEAEPNGGTPETSVNAWDPTTIVEGVIGTAGDADVFKVDTRAGRVYRVTLEAPAGSDVDGWLTVMDTGRGDEAAGSDYVKLASDADGPGASLDFLAMGDGHYVIARDKRGQGGATHTYRLHAEVLDAVDFASQALEFPASFEHDLPSPGGLRIYPFEGAEGTDVRFDLKRRGRTLDARLFVFNVGEGSWIARNDNRSASSDDPLIDAPLTASGAQYVVVENIEEGATDLGYTLSASKP